MVFGRRRHLVPPNLGAAFPAGYRCRQRESRSRTEPTKNGSHTQSERFGCSDVQNMAKVITVTEGCKTLGVPVGPRQHIADPLMAKADVIRAMHERVQPCQDTQTAFALLRESVVSTTSCEFTATQSFRNSGLQKSTTRLGSGLLFGSSRFSRGAV